ncbi:hypothetical protein GGQ80_000818 [Sphingomonas jinjuensis]|uniref:Uncharacterized protein n=1 Tax=Sphingomonas jinjuensis TaxID=535907 RepID=A0A840F4W3_9SPHN|nr:hypothetical protein [Sphingomonas jinjuensis]MBB4152930.1 hypothetical protein [Sphingomonas jinjuensis]
MNAPPLPVPTQLRRMSRFLVVLGLVNGFALAFALGGNLRVAVAALAINNFGLVIVVTMIRGLLNRRTFL